MSKPFVNLDEVAFDDVEENGFYTSRRAPPSTIASAAIGTSDENATPTLTHEPWPNYRARNRVRGGEGPFIR